MVSPNFLIREILGYQEKPDATIGTRVRPVHARPGLKGQLERGILVGSPDSVPLARVYDKEYRSGSQLKFLSHSDFLG